MTWDSNIPIAHFLGAHFRLEDLGYRNLGFPIATRIPRTAIAGGHSCAQPSGGEGKK